MENNRLGAHYQRYTTTNFNTVEQPMYSNNNYQTVYTPSSNEQLSIAGERDIQYETCEYYLSVNSKDRDVVTYPSSNRFVINFQHEFKNILNIELIQGIIPDKNSVTSEPYLLLKIDELDDVMISNDRNISDAFAILQLAPPISTGNFIHIDKRIHENVVKIFKTPKSTLNKMTISITDLSGNLFSFGGDNTVDKAFQSIFVFKIVCLEKRRDALNHRNVF